MTTMIPRYIGIPPEFYDSPKCIEMSHATARFYGFIFWMSHRCSSLQFDVADSSRELAGRSRCSASPIHSTLEQELNR
jgi:hypothetical protein